MGKDTAIAWTDHTFNPWWGCTKVSAGCTNCYAEAFSKRTGGDWWGPNAPRRGFGDKHWTEPEKWDRDAARLGVRARVFCGSMCDVFEGRSDLDAARARLWALVRRTPNLDWLLLTKRPENMPEMLPLGGFRNAWLGISVPNASALVGLSVLRAMPAPVHFLSMEPLVEATGFAGDDLTGIEWVIVGGESGPRARPMDVEWARLIRDQCRVTGTAFFMKQLGGRRDKRDRLEDFPEDLRIREFPRARREGETTP